MMDRRYNSTGTGHLRVNCPSRNFIDFIILAAQIVLVLFAALQVTEKEALAYSDPGSGALIWQMMVASLFGGMFYFRKVVEKIRSWRGKAGEGPESAGKEESKE